MLYFTFLIPLFVAVIYLFTATAFKTDSVFSGTIFFHLPPLVLTLFPVVWLILKYGLRSNQPSREFWLYMCFLSPFAVIYPWVITSGTPSAGYGGFLYFIEWLTKHPNLGPINIQVLIGTVCVIGIALLPAIYAYQALAEKPELGKLIFYLSLFLLFFAPVFIRLDLMLWLSGWSGEPLSANNGGARQGLALLYGPLLHTAPLFVMIWHVTATIAHKPAHYR